MKAYHRTEKQQKLFTFSQFCDIFCIWDLSTSLLPSSIWSFIQMTASISLIVWHLRPNEVGSRSLPWIKANSSGRDRCGDIDYPTYKLLPNPPVALWYRLITKWLLPPAGPWDTEIQDNFWPLFRPKNPKLFHMNPATQNFSDVVVHWYQTYTSLVSCHDAFVGSMQPTP